METIETMDIMETMETMDVIGTKNSRFPLFVETLTNSSINDR